MRLQPRADAERLVAAWRPLGRARSVAAAMTFLGVEVQVRDMVFALLIAPLIVIGLWAGCALLFAVGG